MIQNTQALTLHSSAFKEGETIPQEYTCEGEKKSPPLSWSNVPEGTKSFVLICDDPDAPHGTWDHWIVMNIPASVKTLETNLQVLPQGAFSGLNSWNKHGYGAPCPPQGQHRYIFHLYALDVILRPNQNMKKSDVHEAMKGHILEKTQLTGVYRKGE